MNYNQNLDKIRGIAALLIVFYHYFIFFFTNQEFCARLCCFPPLIFTDPLIEKIKDFPFDIGQLAVAFFFFLSGYLVICLVERHPARWAFFKNRFFRLWPIFVVGLLINIVCIQLGAYFSGLEFPHTTSHILSSALCLRDFLGYPYITGIVWTFEIEVKFVLACLLVFPLLKSLEAGTLLLLQIALFAIVASVYLSFQENEDFPEYLLIILKTLSFSSKYFCLLLMGLYVNYFAMKKISLNYFLFLVLLAFLTFSVEDYFMISLKKHLSHFINYGLAFLIFCNFTLRKIQEEKGLVKTHFSKTLSYISKISYPLYLVHAVPGYVLMYILYDYGYSLSIGIIISFFLSLIIASLLHKYVEEPFRHSFWRFRLKWIS